MKRLFALVVVGLALTAFATPAQAGIVFYTNQANWQAAVGPASFTEDFSGFAADTQFRTAVVPLNGMTITQEGPNAGNFRNFVDVSPFEFSDNGGTAHASSFTNADAPGTFVRIAFNSPVSAFGFQTWNAADGEHAVLGVYDGATLLGSQALSNGSGDFLGFVLTGGDVATSVRFSSLNLNPGSGGEGFALDNLAGVTAGQVAPAAIPEPATLAVFGALAAGAFGVRRRVRATSGR